MNMMTGAVAINGGVGVMEIHQPQVAVSQMAASAAQAAEQVALNAHITLRELKTKIDTVVEKKLPTFKTLTEKEPVAVAQTMVNPQYRQYLFGRLYAGQRTGYRG